MAAAPAVVVLIDHRDPRWLRSASALLAAAHRLARDHGWDVHTAWVGHDHGHGHDHGPGGELGAAVQHVVDVEGADPHLASTVSAALEAVVAALDATGPARLVLLPSTFEGREVAARLAAATGAGVVVGASSVTVEEDDDGGSGHVVAQKSVLAGSWHTRCAVTSELAIVALDTGAAGSADGASLPQDTPSAAVAPVVHHHRAPRPAGAAVEVLSRSPRPAGDRPALAEADVVVVGGRGTGGDFSGVEDLADALGGAVGATRVATDEGWAPRALQVGQTGVTISPRLYVGAGVSGAVHHRGGMAASGTVVAINTDPDAPIFEHADIAVVADATTLLPALAEEVRARRSRETG
ncbi:electron transfer flavoprotein alpha subunit apoprotein [Quadrisphaera granulorum]|uniref:Electron transfer flavoprotein alpha subunit apoprotein n=1 Tax=Quadrisphaera granulorum TaxID=317664 RepID=A0A315ZJ94_9ACTN|nr:FAD-binding protein [Quadrisphaera granulorum]PWJ45621.1 electron transfer flavoprotein alpha subunit apoprotein [Quadrisphaera granulorum]SZE99152.1 electron transfer flavoprotein alpha subunit apoprotein [Quadrisphaera granulorum]